MTSASSWSRRLVVEPAPRRGNGCRRDTTESEAAVLAVTVDDNLPADDIGNA
jgi:hypothetical protein